MAKRSYNARHLWPAAVAALLLATCTDRQHRNPLDPETDQPAFEVSGLEVIAGDERVQLRWDFSRFVDITGVRLHREVTSSLTGDGTGALARDLPPSAAEYVDDDLVNGTTYRYHLGIVVKGEGERQRRTGQIRHAGSRIRVDRRHRQQGGMEVEPGRSQRFLRSGPLRRHSGDRRGREHRRLLGE